MVTVALLLCFSAADFRLVKDPAEVSGWKLLRDGKPADVLPRDSAEVFTLDTEWREAVRKVRRKAGGETEKQLYIGFLKKRYGYQIRSVNQAYGLDAAAFTELESSDFAGLDEKLPEVLADDVIFASECYAERIQTVLGEKTGKIRVLAIPDGLPAEIVWALGGLKEVDAIGFWGQAAVSLKGLEKPLVRFQCPAVKPPFATACAGI